MAEILEVAMVVLFGVSWPISIRKSFVTKTAKGKSLSFLFLILLGYACGIASKFVSGTITYVLFFYILNLVMVATDIVLFLRNTRYDRRNDTEDL